MLENMFENIKHSSFSSNPSYKKWDDYKAQIHMVKNSLKGTLLVRASELPMNLSKVRYSLEKMYAFFLLVLVSPKNKIYKNLLKDLAKKKETKNN